MANGGAALSAWRRSKRSISAAAAKMKAKSWRPEGKIKMSVVAFQSVKCNREGVFL